MASALASLAALLPSIPYPPPEAALHGYWLPVTSTLNWCEEDYYATRFIAELINTITNGLFVLLALKGVRSTLRNQHDSIFLVSYAGYATVGTGSILFHATLKYPMQLVDELSMIYTTCFSCYSSFSYRRSRLVGLVIALALLSLAIFITAYYHYIQNPVFHQRCYALLTTTVIFRSMGVMELHLRPSLRRRRAKHIRQQKEGKVSQAEEAEQKRVDERDMRILRTMWKMVGYGLTLFLGGFLIWTGDNKLCGSLRGWRRELGLPWGFLLEGHGWWHIMTGIGAYFFITWTIWLRHCLNGKEDQYEIYWPSLVFSIPVIVKKDGPDAYMLEGLPKKQKIL